jgi:hypothetical protein
MTIRSYTKLLQIPGFQERYDYLRLTGTVGAASFGFDRRFNQDFYHSREWRHSRDEVVLRDEAFDLGVRGHEIGGPITVHHMNIVTIELLESGDSSIFDPEFLISVSSKTHLAIHYGNSSNLPQLLVQRQPGDTSLW